MFVAATFENDIRGPTEMSWEKLCAIIGFLMLENGKGKFSRKYIDII